MAKYLLALLGLMLGPCVDAQSRLDALPVNDPVFRQALDSVEVGNSAAAAKLLQTEKTKFKQEQEWTKYGFALILLGRIHFQAQRLDTALLTLQEALKISKQIGNDRATANIEEGIARVYLAMRQLPQAYAHYRNFARWCFQHGKPKAKVETCLQMVYIYVHRMESDSVKHYLRRGFTEARGYYFPVLQLKLNQMAGLAWSNWNRPDSALYYARQGLSCLERHPSDEKAVFFNLCIAQVFIDNQNISRARKYWHKAQSFAQRSGKPFLKLLLQYYEGYILLGEKKPQQALPVLEKTLSGISKLRNPQKHNAFQARCLNAIAETYHNLGNDEKALHYLEQSQGLDLLLFARHNEVRSELLEAAILSDQDAVQASDELLMQNLIWAKKSANLKFQLQLYQTLAANERKKKNYEQAIAYLDKVKTLEKKLDPVLRASLLHNSETQWEMGKKEQSIHQLEESNQRKSQGLQAAQRKALYLLSALLLLGILSLGVYWQKRRQNQNLALEKQQIETSLQEKELLLKEIHHRVKNNMQVISSLLNLQARSVQDPLALKVMREGRDRVRSMALIHQTLYQNNEYSTVETKDYFLKLAENLFHTYNIDQNRVQLIAQIEPLKFNVDMMISLGLILNELISNTLKYAFPGEQCGEVRISLAAQAGQVELKVEDNGVGLPTEFQPEASPSIGYSLMQAFSQKLGGSLRLDNASKGSRASLIFPLTNTHTAA
jgi:two-component sensor histidine kinase